MKLKDLFATIDDLTFLCVVESKTKEEICTFKKECVFTDTDFTWKITAVAYRCGYRPTVKKMENFDVLSCGSGTFYGANAIFAEI